MPARIVLVHAEVTFTDDLAARLEREGHEVVTFNDQRFTASPPRNTDVLELTVSRVGGDHPGLQINVTGFPASEPYAGFLGQFLAEPVTVSDLMDALRRFGV